MTAGIRIYVLFIGALLAERRRPAGAADEAEGVAGGVGVDAVPGLLDLEFAAAQIQDAFSVGPTSTTSPSRTVNARSRILIILVTLS